MLKAPLDERALDKLMLATDAAVEAMDDWMRRLATADIAGRQLHEQLFEMRPLAGELSVEPGCPFPGGIRGFLFVRRLAGDGA